MKRKILYIIGGILVFFITIIIASPNQPQTSSDAQSKIENPDQKVSENIKDEPKNPLEEINVINEIKSQTSTSEKYYPIVSVVDGDTVKINLDGKTTTLRLIGLDTPETVDPRKPVQCFGVEASNKAKELLSGKKVRIENDSTQGNLDKYGRTLAYIYLEDGTFYNKYMIEQGYAHEYTYDLPYKYQAEFKNAEKDAKSKQLGLWSPNTCNGDTTTESSSITQTTTASTTNTGSNSCTIKGNISSTGEKIYHVIGCGSYTKTVIDESKGEKWFCTEQEAISAGWRKALNCN